MTEKPKVIVVTDLSNLHLAAQLGDLERVFTDIFLERLHQVQKGRDAEHDDRVNDDGELSRAAACWISDKTIFVLDDDDARQITFAEAWPWLEEYDKRATDAKDRLIDNDRLIWRDRRALIVKGIALAIAEVQRIDRAIKLAENER